MIYRKDPVPYTGNGSWSFGIHYKTPKTRNEYRQTEGHIDEYGNWIVRGRRRPRNLPNAWDDIPRSNGRSHRTWKRHRSTQYK